ncbi:MAG TPA: rod shape-determining protein MreC [Gemmatimonadales bacterium]|nr:rod shape-determining protein MreC [Gemmatimonadales bacterium]
MLSASDRTYSRRDTATLLVCVALSLVVLLMPPALGQSLASSLRETVLTPAIWLQARAQEGRTSRSRFAAVVAQRDSAAAAAQLLPVLTAENMRLRELVALGRRMQLRYVAAEVLHQPTATDDRMLLLDVGAEDSVRGFEPVIAPEGLIGVIANRTQRTATVMTWAHPEFRVSAYTADGRVFGLVAPSSGSMASEAALEFRAASYRDTLAPGTLVLSSGLGGVYPKGIPVGTVVGVAREQEGWERVYTLRPSANPSAVPHVMVVLQRGESLAEAFPSDSILAAVRADSLAQAAAADSARRVRIADSVRAVIRDSLARLAQQAAPAAAPRRNPAAATPADSVTP